MRVAISLRLATEDWERGSAYVVEADRLGTHSVWTAEAWGHDAVAPLAFLAARPSRIGLGTIRVEPAGDTLDGRLANLGRVL